MTAVVDDARQVIGIFTDGDIRRTLEKERDFQRTPIAEVMTRNPQTIGPDKLAAEAVEIMERHRISQMLVVDERGRLLGALNMHDLFRAKVI
jgi:arabinose-5-phosphate isomerase